MEEKEERNERPEGTEETGKMEKRGREKRGRTGRKGLIRDPLFCALLGGALIAAGVAISVLGPLIAGKMEKAGRTEERDSGTDEGGTSDSGYLRGGEEAEDGVLAEGTGKMLKEAERAEEEKKEDYGREGSGEASGHTLTASAHDDNLDYAGWKELFLEKGQDGKEGKFRAYLNERFECLDSQKRLSVSISGESGPVRNATVKLLKDGKEAFRTSTDINGLAYVFGAGEGDVVRVEYSRESSEQDVGSETEYSFSLKGSSSEVDTLDLMFVVDATGSMGDELDFLKAEIQEVVERIKEDDVKVRISFVYYRDYDDAELVYLEDFSDAGQRVYVDKLESEYAEGGGDYEEAIDVAFEKACGAKWSDDSIKLVFHFFDAPIHDDEGTIASYGTYLRELVSKGLTTLHG